MSKAVNMKKLLLCFVAAVFAICLSAGLMTGCSSNAKSSSDAPEYLGEDGKFVVGFDETFKPFGYKDDNGEYTGFDLELAKAVAEKNGWEIELPPSIGTPRMLRSIPVRSTSSGMASPSKAVRTPMSSPIRTT